MARWESPSSRWSAPLLAAALVGLAVALRVLPFRGTLPYFISDGGFEVEVALGMVQRGDLNPHYFKCGGFPLYWLAGIYYVYFRLSHWLGGAERTFSEFVGSATLEHSDFALFSLGRASSLLLGLVGIYLVFLIARCFFGRKAAWLSAFFSAVSPSFIFFSQVINVDVFSMVFSLLTVYFSVRVWREGRLRDYLLAGMAAGLTVASKYNFIVVVPVCTAHFLRRMEAQGPLRQRMGLLLISLYLGAVVFFLSSPFALLSYGEFSAFLTSFFQVHGTIPLLTEQLQGKKMFPNILGQLFIMLPLLSGPLLLCACGGVWKARKEKKALVLLLSFPVSYLAFSGIFMKEISPQYSLPLFPYVLIFGSQYCINAVRAGRGKGRTAALALGTASVLFFASDLAMPHYRQPLVIHRKLGQWVEAHVRPGEKVLVTRMFFPPVRSFWSGRSTLLDSPEDFREHHLAKEQPEYIVVLFDDFPVSGEQIVGTTYKIVFFDVDRYTGLARRLEKGEFSYREVASFGFPRLYRKVFGLVFPYHGPEMRYSVFRRSPGRGGK